MSDDDAVTRRLVDYARTAEWNDLPPSVRQHASSGVLNILGCMLGGCVHRDVAAVDDALAQFCGPPTAVIAGRGFRRDPLHAALVNAVSANVRTFDDTHAEAVVHPSGPVVAALLSASGLRKASGDQFLLAYALGAEVTCRLAKAISIAPGKTYFGWSLTGICTAIGGTLAVARLLDLSQEATFGALTIAVAQAAGLRVAQGSIASPLMSGQAAQIAFRSAVLAERGIKGHPNSLEAKNGFLEAFSQVCDRNALTGDLGSRYEILRNLYKPYPCGVVIHSVIDACLAIVDKTKLSSKEITSISIRINPLVVALTDRRHPNSGLAAQVSVYHWVAACFVQGQADLHSVDQELIDNPEIRRLRDAITLVSDQSVPGHAAEVSVETSGHGTLRHRIDIATGSIDKPMTPVQIERKFISQATLVMSEDVAARAHEALGRLADHDDVAALAAKHLVV